MITEILNPQNDKDAIEKAVQILIRGGIVAIPTETVYGLAASSYDDNAILNVFKAKGRPQDNPLIVHISDTDMLKDVAVNVPDTAYKLAKKFWPGPLTMVLDKNDKIAKSVSAGLDTVAVRCPDNKIAYNIIKSSKLPLAAPSANVSGAPSPTTYKHVVNDLDGKIDAIVVGDNCKVGVESTVISLKTNPPRLLRPGAVTVEELKKILPDLVVDKAVLSEPKKDESVASPGMKYKHYAPKTETFLVEGSTADFIDFVNLKTGAVAVCFDQELKDIKIKKVSYGDGLNAITLAQNLFSVLRDIDLLNADAVYVHAPQKSGVGLAVYNRLIRAAAFRVIKL